MKRFLAYVLGVALIAMPAAAQNTSVWLADAADGDGTVSIGSIGGTGTIQLWMSYSSSANRLIGIDSILTGYDALFGDTTSFEVSGFNDQVIPGSGMQRLTRGDVAGDLPNGDIDDYQYVGDDLDAALNPDGLDGLQGPATVLLDEIVITGTADNSGVGPDQVFFAFGVQAPGGNRIRVRTIPPPATWIIEDETVTRGTGDGESSLNPLLVGVVPEPASLALLAVGGLVAIRRRR
jgi:hypothetical protein